MWLFTTNFILKPQIRTKKQNKTTTTTTISQYGFLATYMYLKQVRVFFCFVFCCLFVWLCFVLFLFFSLNCVCVIRFGHIIRFIHPIHRFKSSDWFEKGHMTWIIFDNDHVWKLIHVCVIFYYFPDSRRRCHSCRIWNSIAYFPDFTFR